MVYSRVRRFRRGNKPVKKMVKSGRKMFKMYKRRINRPIDSRIHRFKEILRSKIVINNDTIQTPAADDPAGTQYRYVSGRLEDFIDLTASSGASVPNNGNNKTLNNVRRGGLKNIFDRMRIDKIVFKFISPHTSLDMGPTGSNNQQGTFNLYTSLDKDGGGTITSLYNIRERGNVRVRRLGGYSKIHTVICKPYTDYRTVGQDNQGSVNLAKPLYWFDVQNIYEGFTTGVPRLNLGHWFVEAPTDILGSQTNPVFNMVLDCQITVYYSMKNQI